MMAKLDSELHLLLINYPFMLEIMMDYLLKLKTILIVMEFIGNILTLIILLQLIEFITDHHLNLLSQLD
ncbi:MAG: hypothetical protein COB96_06345 [Planctomycetota bacterium]|nr:MAG: hypothetical protein COB96_06345 [Planctomycetota bacterium]